MSRDLSRSPELDQSQQGLQTLLDHTEEAECDDSSSHLASTKLKFRTPNQKEKEE
jgi:hypothetical protein